MSDTNTKPNENLPWFDVETTGLSFLADVVLEVGLVITDVNLNVLDEASWVVYANDHRYHYALDGMGDFVRQMHTDNGLLDEVYDNSIRVSPNKAALGISDLLRAYDLPVSRSTPLCGSSVQFDRTMLDANFPAVLDGFSYRNLDVSSFKEWWERKYPEQILLRDEHVVPQKKHRVIPDIYDTLAEFQFYVDGIEL